MKKTICLILALIICSLTFFTVNCAAAVVEDDNGTGYCLFGDVNRDGAIDVRDLVRIERYEADSQVDICLNAADIDGDGQISDEDLVELRISLLGVNDGIETGGAYWSELY